MERAERIRRIEAFLQEAVFQSRAKQAAGTFLANASASCGLGAKAEVVLDLSPRANELFQELWPAGANESELERIRATLREWIEAQDALDRQRNHFLKAFRHAHGFDRSSYAPDVRAQFDDGLARVNAEVDARRRAAAERLA